MAHGLGPKMAANKQTSKSHQNSGTLGGGPDEPPSVRPCSPSLRHDGNVSIRPSAWKEGGRGGLGQIGGGGEEGVIPEQHKKNS